MAKGSDEGLSGVLLQLRPERAAGVHRLGRLLPGSPRARSMAEVERRALADAEALAEGGVEALLVENFGDAPFHRGDARDPVPPHVPAALGADGVKILADVGVKHAAALAGRPIEEEARDAVERGLADGLLVTGPATGAPPDPERLRAVRAAVAVPVLIGSGLTPENAPRLWPLADGAVVGTFFHRDGRLGEPVDPARVRALVEGLRGLV